MGQVGRAWYDCCRQNIHTNTIRYILDTGFMTVVIPLDRVGRASGTCLRWQNIHRIMPHPGHQGTVSNSQLRRSYEHLRVYLTPGDEGVTTHSKSRFIIVPLYPKVGHDDYIR